MHNINIFCYTIYCKMVEVKIGPLLCLGIASFVWPSHIFLDVMAGHFGQVVGLRAWRSLCREDLIAGHLIAALCLPTVPSLVNTHSSAYHLSAHWTSSFLHVWQWVSALFWFWSEDSFFTAVPLTLNKEVGASPTFIHQHSSTNKYLWHVVISFDPLPENVPQSFEIQLLRKEK